MTTAQRRLNNIVAIVDRNRLKAMDASDGPKVLDPLAERWRTFGWAVREGAPYRDGWVETRFKPVAGREDRAGGVVWRWRDADNYYVARANALEDNVVAYKVVKGRRTDLTPVDARPGTYGVKVPVATGAWHTLRVDFTGARFEITYDGRRLFAVRDETFPDAGLVGIWSKADSVTEFDRFQQEGAP